MLFGPIISGVGLIYAGLRDRGLWILVYPMGLLRWQRGEVITFPWDEVTDLVFYRVVECDNPKREVGADGELISAWLPIAKMGSRTLGAHVVLRRNDGVEAILPSSLFDFRRLCRIAQVNTFRALWPNVWAQFLDGRQVEFGSLSLSVDGIHFDKVFLGWHDLEDALVQIGKLIVRSRRQHRPWASLPLQGVSNPHVLAALLIAGPTAARLLAAKE